jgi:hypothetical protein
MDIVEVPNFGPIALKIQAICTIFFKYCNSPGHSRNDFTA